MGHPAKRTILKIIAYISVVQVIQAIGPVHAASDKINGSRKRA